MADTEIRVLCYDDSNTWGPDIENGGRLGRHMRWTGVLADRLGPDFVVIEEGLGGRTTVRDDPCEPFRNGLAYPPPCLISHDPVDVVVMLGTNDLKRRFSVTAEDIGRGAALVCDCIAQYAPTAKVMLVAPPPLGPVREAEIPLDP